MKVYVSHQNWYMYMYLYINEYKSLLWYRHDRNVSRRHRAINVLHSCSFGAFYMYCRGPIC